MELELGLVPFQKELPRPWPTYIAMQLMFKFAETSPICENLLYVFLLKDEVLAAMLSFFFFCPPPPPLSPFLVGSVGSAIVPHSEGGIRRWKQMGN